jgi:uncharacterized protein DUF488
MMLEIFTIGHSNRTWADFLKLLRAHGIQRVIDVRSIPRSRHNPQFGRDTLPKKLRAARIAYVHLRKLGGRAAPPPIHRTRLGVTPRFVAMPITCRPRISAQAWTGQLNWQKRKKVY